MSQYLCHGHIVAENVELSRQVEVRSEPEQAAHILQRAVRSKVRVAFAVCVVVTSRSTVCVRVERTRRERPVVA